MCIYAPNITAKKKTLKCILDTNNYTYSEIQGEFQNDSFYNPDNNLTS